MQPFLSANVDDVTAVWADIALRLTFIADEYPAASLMEIAIERPIIVAGTAVHTSNLASRN